MLQSAIIIDKNDNVATALRPLRQGESIGDVTTIQNIPVGHKYALTDIELSQPVIKYGETIGMATANILAGEHVHIHNAEGSRGRGDRR